LNVGRYLARQANFINVKKHKMLIDQQGVQEFCRLTNSRINSFASIQDQQNQTLNQHDCGHARDTKH